jgi:hypothetical protein
MSVTLRPVSLDTYWGIIQSGARARLTTAELWSAVRNSSEMAGETLAPGAFSRMNELRSLAGQQIRADSALARLDPTGTITSDQIAFDINSRSVFDQAANPRYRVSFTVSGTNIRSGERTDFRLTDTFGRNLPHTKQDLLDQLSLEAPATVDAYGFVLDEISGDLNIRSV